MDREDGRVVSNFIVQALQGNDITIYGDGSQTRSFCYVDDLITGMIALMNSPKEIVGPINIGNPNEFSILELVKEVASLTGSKSKVVQLPLPEDDPRQRRPDITKAKEILNWVPKVQLKEGLEKTIEYFVALEKSN
jgi:UDP-glucuronate decarboxylase